MHGNVMPNAKRGLTIRADIFERWGPIGLIAAITIATRAFYLGDPAPTFDEQLYNLIGHHMLSGSLPYVDLWDRKPIGLFLIFALAHAIGPLAGLSGTVMYQLFAIGTTFAGGWLVWHLASLLKPGRGALVAGVTYPVLISMFGSQVGQSEAYYMPLMLGILALVEKGMRHADRENPLRIFSVAMLLAGVGLQIKYTVAPQCVFLGLVCLWVLHRCGTSLARLASIGALFAILGLLPTLAALLYYILVGQADAFIFANFISIFDRGAPPGSKFNFLLPYFVLPAAFAIAGMATLVLRRERPSSTYLLYAGWTVSCAAGVFMGSTVYPYYLASVIPGALLMATPLFAVQSRTLTFAFLGSLLILFNFPGRLAFSHNTRIQLVQLTKAVQPYVGAKSHCLYVFDGPSALYEETGSCLPTRFIYPDHLNNALEEHSLGVDTAGEIRRIFANKPGAVITANFPVTVQNKSSTAALHELLGKYYRALTTIKFGTRMLTIHIPKHR